MKKSSAESRPESSGKAAQNFQSIPSELRALPQWVCWKLEIVAGRLTKVPYSATTGRKASTTDPATWASFEQCLAAHRNGRQFNGIGFVFTDSNGLTGIDLDHHRDPQTGELDEFAKTIVARLDSYTEASQGGAGVHIIARGVIPSDKGKRDAKQGVEMYSTARFFVMTGRHLDGTPATVQRRQSAVAALFQELFGERKQETKPAPAPAPVESLTLTDNDLLNKASRASNGATFSALWRGDFASAGFGSQSEADGALLSMLHFWTGGDKDRSFRLFSQSGLNRDKWARADYRESTWALVANGKTYSPQSAAHASATQQPTGGSSQTAETPQPPPVKRLSQLDRRTENDPTELLKSAYLCRGGGALFVAPTGIGKSVAEVQAAICWGIGQHFFGIVPARPLKSLIIQAEDDEGDMSEFADGIVQGLRLTPAQIMQADESVFTTREDSRTGLPLCIYTIEPLLAAYRPDLLWLNPAHAYLGGDTSSQEIVGGFLRNMLNPLLRKYGCAGIVIHHTTKPPRGKEKPDWQAGDYAYLGAGSAEFANWARCVLAIRSIGQHAVFELRAGKRGSRIGWKDETGLAAYSRFIAHSKEPGLIYWRDAEPDEAQSADSPRAKTPEDLIALVPLDRPILKSVLLDRAQGAGIGSNKARTLLEILIEDKRLYVGQRARAGTNPAKLISRKPEEQE